MENLRCFIAVDLPGDVKKMLSDVQKELMLWPAKVKWVEQQNFHLTLKFLGDLPAAKFEKIESVLAGISAKHKSGEIQINGIGAFANTSNPRVIWAGIRDSGKGLLKLRDDIEAGLGQIGIPKEERRFSPHLTLGRVKEPVPGLAGIIKNLQPLKVFVSYNEIKLMKSRLSRQGPEYSCINSFYLQEH